jgi:UDP-N-acetylglucosamine diphosphorylase / glucose-1-phosphate thymidylyltransferase / UDP-N-acetylgalactosamine diphosphorylase / glucosamine-1-phosphate N-acetyltransferase / galactosamine-1-phosphate N-acetyltransferase
MNPIHTKINVVIPMSGLGKRFSDSGYNLPKPLLPIGNKTMIEAVVENLQHPLLKFIFIVNSTLISPVKIRELTPDDSIIVDIDFLPDGPAMSAMKAEKWINNSNPLIIVNCDQIIEDFNLDTLLSFQKTYDADGILGTFYSSNPMCSYVKINDINEIIDVREKEVISNIATNGLHYWAKGSYFINSMAKMIKNKDVVNGEYYIAPSFKYMLQDGMTIKPFSYNLHFPVGTPIDYEKYKTKRRC